MVIKNLEIHLKKKKKKKKIYYSVTFSTCYGQKSGVCVCVHMCVCAYVCVCVSDTALK